ncbi:MAG TPA: DJ-1/PfpI family protein [Thermoanaerobaculia bacterium]|nr:DJ-1/PfpI family protein [Thermoanaerobaculia bacterium]
MRKPLTILTALLLLGGCVAEKPEVQEDQAAATPAPATNPVPSPTPAPPVASADPNATPVPGQTGPAADLPKDRPLRAGILVVNGVYNTELAAPFDVLQHTRFHTQPGMEVFTVSPDGQPITTFEGLKLTPDYAFANAPAIDVLVVPSARGSMDADLQNQALIDWVRKTGSQARNVISLCDGAFILAKADLLQGIPATTFPDDYGRFSQQFPDVDLRINVSFVDAGKVITSQGAARSYEATMHLVNRLYGRQVAAGIGKGLLVPWPPDPDTMTARIVEPTAPSTSPTPTPGPS